MFARQSVLSESAELLHSKFILEVGHHFYQEFDDQKNTFLGDKRLPSVINKPRNFDGRQMVRCQRRRHIQIVHTTKRELSEPIYSSIQVEHLVAKAKTCFVGVIVIEHVTLNLLLCVVGNASSCRRKNKLIRRTDTV
jgi:hypothetical protein